MRNTIIIFIALIFGFALSATSVGAEETNSGSTDVPTVTAQSANKIPPHVKGELKDNKGNEVKDKTGENGDKGKEVKDGIGRFFKSKKNNNEGEVTGRRSVVGGEVKDGIGREMDKNGEEVKDRSRDKNEREIKDRSSELKEKRDEQREKLLEKRKERTLAYAERMTKRLNAALDRIKKLGDRVDSRISKLKERGVDTTRAEELMGEARISVSVAREGVVNAKAAIVAALELENPKEAFEEVRRIVKGVVENIKSAHMATVEAIKALKASLKEVELTPDNEEGEVTGQTTTQ